jgi:Na+-transporting methylmalonyl-CoA/oxaloacetate decarboxylase gamma subunit
LEAFQVTTALLVTGIVLVFVQLCFLLASILLIGGLIRAQTNLLDEQVAEIENELEFVSEADEPGDWADKWPPWTDQN